MDLSFFDAQYRWMGHGNVVTGNGFMLDQVDLNGSTTNTYNLDRLEVYPNIWITTDTLVKSMYSAVMADLGQPEQPNILYNSTALQALTADFFGMTNPDVNINVGPAMDSYENLRSETGSLQSSPGVVFTKYFCQVPKRKATGSLFVSILIADWCSCKLFGKSSTWSWERI